MDNQVSFDREFTLYITADDGTTPLVLSTLLDCYVYLLTADKTTIVKYTYAATGNFMPVSGQPGYYTVKFDNADNANNYTGDVYFEIEFKTTDASYDAGYSLKREGPVKIGTIKPDMP